MIMDLTLLMIKLLIFSRVNYSEDEKCSAEQTVNDVSVTANAKIPNWTTNFTDITTESFTQDSGPCLPEKYECFCSKSIRLLQPIIQTRNI